VPKGKAYSPEFRREAAREVVEKSRPIATVARELGVVPQTLGNWVRVYREERDVDGTVLSVAEKARVRELERENRELREKVAFLEKAAAFFAQNRR
jgi:transposase-like protein